MSVCSSASSVSVTLRGEEVDLETALDTTVRDLQKHLNMVQCQLRTLAAGSERDDDYEDQIKIADELQDNIMRMGWLFEELYGMAYEIVGEAETKEEKAFLKAHKADRKIQIAKMKAEHLEQKKLEKENSKNANKLENKTMEDD